MASSGAGDELKQIENEWVSAVKAKDAAKLGAILAESWVGLGWNGKITDKIGSEIASPGYLWPQFVRRHDAVRRR